MRFRLIHRRSLREKAPGRVRRRVGSAAGAMLASFGLLVTGALPAQALNADEVSWVACSWVRTTDVVRVGASGFAADSTSPPDSNAPNGAPQSFTARIQDAVNEWNVMTTNSAYRFTYSLAYSTTTSPRILFRSVNPSVGDENTQGYTYVQTRSTGLTSDFYGACPRKRTQYDAPFEYARIDMKVQNTWFTQGADRRAYWENCSERSSYTCAKQVDFGSIATHELGHAIGQAHPENSTESSAARCSSQAYKATMCPNIGFYRTEWRTKETWDLESYRYHSQNFFR